MRALDHSLAVFGTLCCSSNRSTDIHPAVSCMDLALQVAGMGAQVLLRCMSPPDDQPLPSASTWNSTRRALKQDPVDEDEDWALRLRRCLMSPSVSAPCRSATMCPSHPHPFLAAPPGALPLDVSCRPMLAARALLSSMLEPVPLVRTWFSPPHLHVPVLQRISAGVYAPQLHQWRSKWSRSQVLVLTADTTAALPLASAENRRRQVQVSEFLGVPLAQQRPQPDGAIVDDQSRLPSMSCALHDALTRVYSQWNEVLYAMEPQLERFAPRLPCIESSGEPEVSYEPLSDLACEAQCQARNTAWYTACGGVVPPWEATAAECRACALCPDLRSPKTLNRNHKPAPHGGMVNGGTVIEAIGLLQRPRQPCVIEHWPGWIEVIHYFSPKLATLEKSMFWMFPASPRRSGLWFPPGRVLVCEDALDLANFVNFTEFTLLHASVARWNAASPPGSFLYRKPDVTSTRFERPELLKEALLEAASARLSKTVDTIAFVHHMDGFRDTIYGSGLGHEGTILLNTEYALLSSSHTFKLAGCPVSSSLRRERKYHPNQTWAPSVGDPSQRSPFLELEPCKCDLSFSAMC